MMFRMPRRMFKKAVQRGRSERRAEAYSVRSVEALSDVRTKLAAFFNILLVVAVTACGPATVHVVKSSEFREAVNQPLAVLPFRTAPLHYSPGGFPFSSSQVSPEGATTVTRLFQENLRAREGVSIIPFEQVEAALSAEDVHRLGQDSAHSLARTVGAALNAGTVLVGTVSQYRQRIGNALGIREPASVGFEATVIRVEDGTVLWVGRFFETQRPMTEDLQGFLSRRRWLTARELAEDGVRKVLDEGWPRGGHARHSSH